jgi:16S rRNA (cytosine967-C5)-methyltransferase
MKRRPGPARSSSDRFSPFEPVNARQAAWCLLEQFDTEGEYISRTLEHARWKSKLPFRDRLLAQELAELTLRRRLTIECLLDGFVARPREEVEDGLWRILELGVSQLVLMPRIDDHAAIFETVEIATWLRNPRWKGFINGILREIQRQIEGVTPDKKCTLIPMPNDQKTLFPGGFFPEPEHSEVFTDACLYSLPEWIVDRWKKNLSPQDYTQALESTLAPGPVTLRVNTSATTRDKLLEMWVDEEIDLLDSPHPDLILLRKNLELSRLPGYKEGYFFVQDPSALLAVNALNPQPGESILDLCSAPGTKATQIADRMQNQGRVLACDVIPLRLQKVEDNIQRGHYKILETRLIPRNHATFHGEHFDAVLVDTPCSNTGVMGKRAEVRWRLRPNDFVELSEIQLDLLETAHKAVKRKGRIVYSTCSLEAEENMGVVDKFLKRHPEYTCVDSKLTPPTTAYDGSFWALLKS